MYPDSPFAHARGSFLRPVPVPLHSPDDGGQKTVSVACDWLPYIRGALQQLLLQTTWQTDDPAVILQAQQWAFTLIDLFDDADCSTGPAFACPFDFTVGEEGWSVYAPFSLGTYVAATGYQTTFNPGPNLYQAIIGSSTLSGGELNEVIMDYNADGGPSGVGGLNIYYTKPFDVTLYPLFHEGTFSGVGSLHWTGSVTDVDQVLLELNMGGNSSPAYITGASVNGRSTTPPC